MEVFSTPSYSIVLPDEIQSSLDEEVSSFWVEGSDVLLQLSSYARHDGQQVGAAERLTDRLAKGELTETRDIEVSYRASADFACKAGRDRQGAQWVYCYAVWPHLAIFATVFVGTHDLIGPEARWALAAIGSLQPTHEL
jgi:hypothetical protein